jgi:hypothetical protein
MVSFSVVLLYGFIRSCTRALEIQKIRLRCALVCMITGRVGIDLVDVLEHMYHDR